MKHVIKSAILVGLVVSLSGCNVIPNAVGWYEGLDLFDAKARGMAATKKAHNDLAGNQADSREVNKVKTKKSNISAFYSEKAFSVVNTRDNNVTTKVKSGQKFAVLPNAVEVKGQFYNIICIAQCEDSQRYIVGLVSDKGSLHPMLYTMIAQNKRLDYEATTLKISSNNVSFKVSAK